MNSLSERKNKKMSTAEIILISIGLAADAFAVSVCKGLNMRKVSRKNSLIIGLFFGGFQALMPFLGWILGKQFEKYIVSIDHWIVFVLLAFIGGKMIYEALTEDENVFFSLYETYNALLSIGAAKTADELKRFIELMPENTFEERIMPEWDWFFADSEREKLIKEIDSAASGYLDGLISDLLWSYCTSDIETAKRVLANH